MPIKTVPVASIRLDGGTQPRVAIDQDAVQEYGHLMASGHEFPPVVVFHDGIDTWLGDGFHRVLGARSAGLVVIACDWHTGTQRDAVLWSVGANHTHGLRRTNADKRKAVQTMLADAEWAAWPDRKIAQACGCTHPFVAGLRRPQVETVTTPRPADENKVEHQTDNASSLPATVPPAIAAQRAPGLVTVTTQEGQQTAEKVVTVTNVADAGDEAGLSAADLLDEMDRDLRAANAKVETLERAMASDDTKAQVLVALKRAELAERRQAELMEDAAAAKRRADFLGRQLARCGRAVDVQDQDAIAPAVEAMARAAKKVPA